MYITYMYIEYLYIQICIIGPLWKGPREGPTVGPTGGPNIGASWGHGPDSWVRMWAQLSIHQKTK